MKTIRTLLTIACISITGLNANANDLLSTKIIVQEINKEVQTSIDKDLEKSGIDMIEKLQKEVTIKMDKKLKLKELAYNEYSKSKV
jgi:hypothetical protein